MTNDPKQIVAQGYDNIAERHAEWASHTRTEERGRYAALLLETLPAGAQVLELGCGVGLPTTQLLAQHFAVTGVDLSARHITLAQRNVPSATFMHADMTELKLPPASFDAVAAFYSIIHVPRAEQAALYQRVATWLRPGGLFVATLGARAMEAGFEENWLGAPMYWSSFDVDTTKRLVTEAGFQLLSAQEETADEDGVPVTFLWVVAQKPS